MIRRDWKYIQWPEFHYEQLFDLKRDAPELNNLGVDWRTPPDRRRCGRPWRSGAAARGEARYILRNDSPVSKGTGGKEDKSFLISKRISPVLLTSC